MFSFALAQTTTTHNYRFKWTETCRPQWMGAQRQAHFNCVYTVDMLLGYHQRSFIMGIYKTYVCFF